MKDKNDIAESAPEQDGARPVAVADEDIELTPKEEAVVANHLPPNEHSAKIEKKLEHDAAAANRLPDPHIILKRARYGVSALDC